MRPFRPRAAIVLLGVAALLLILAGCSTNRAGIYPYQWSIFWDSLLRPSPKILNGIWLTVSIAITSQIIGVILGIFGALGRLAKLWPARILANIYVWIFRGTPLLVQITLLYYGLLVARIYGWPDLVVLGITLPGQIQAGIFALGVNEGAYMTEIVRAGILSVDTGQLEAARSLGMTYPLAMRRIVLPQAMRVIIPPTGNETISMLKTSSLASVITVTELLYAVQLIYSVNFKTIPLLIVASLWYLIATSILTIGQYYVERHYARGSARALPPTPLQRLRRYLFTLHSELPAPAAGGPEGEAP